MLVSAADHSRHMIVAVVTDEHGSYRFPRSDLPPGQYSLSIRAEGYELPNHPEADVAAAKTEVQALIGRGREVRSCS